MIDLQELDVDIAASQQELDVIAGLMQRAIEENAHAALDQGDYARRYNAMRECYETEKARYDELADQRRERVAKRARIRRFLDDLRKQENLITGFDERAWNALAENITVNGKENLTVRFRDGSEICMK